jgi:hypothetical protein
MTTPKNLAFTRCACPPDGASAGTSCSTGRTNRLVSDPNQTVIDVDWVDAPEAPFGGCYCLSVVYAPWPRTPTGRRRKGLPLDFDWQHPKYTISTTSKEELVAEIERMFNASYAWTEQN